MADEERSVWGELGLIAGAYIILQFIYTWWVGNEPQFKLLQDLPSYLRPKSVSDKISTINLFLYVVITTLPLIISSVLIAFAVLNADEFNIGLLIVCLLFIVIPFGIYLFILDRDLLARIIANHTRAEVNGLSHQSFPSLLMNTAWEILVIYLTTYKLPLFVTSIAFGAWSGRELNSVAK